MIKLSDILNELSVNNPAILSHKKVWKYYENNIAHNHFEFGDPSEGWEEYKELKKSFNNDEDITTDGLLEKLSQQDLNRFYNEMRKLVRKHVGKEIL